MRKTTLFKAFIITFLFIVSSVNGWADTYSYSFSAKVWSAYGAQTLSNISWTATGTAGAYFGYDTNNTPSKGQQFGSSNNSAKALSLSTSGIVGTITSVKVNTCGGSSIAGTVSVSVGNVAFTTPSTALTSTSTDYTFTGSSTGDLVISWSQTSSKAIYIKSIDITYAAITSPPVVSDASPTGNVGTPFTYTISATNAPISFALASGTLPAGLSLNTTIGAITGIPLAVSNAGVTATATNSIGTSTPATLSFNIGKGNQTITFATLDTRTNQDAPFDLTATATSGLAVTYQSSNNSVATVLGSTVTIAGIGTTTITALQGGDSNYNLATSVNQILSVIQYVPPTMVINEIFDPQFSTVVGTSTAKTIDVSGLNLTSGINLSLSGINSNEFSLAQNSISQSGGIAPITFISIMYTPSTDGTHTAMLTLSSDGAMSQVYSISGNATKITDVIVPHSLLAIYVVNDQLKFTAQAGETIEIYNALGQKILHKTTTDGENIISLSQHGVLVVKLGNKVAKIIL